MYVVDRAVLPGPGHDAVGQQPGLVAQPAAGLLDRGRRGRRAGEHHPGRVVGRRASYAAYGRIAALGYNPYTFLPVAAARRQRTTRTRCWSARQWQHTPSVYGPVATWTHLLAAQIGGAKPWLTIWVLMIMIGAAFLATGYVLLRTAANPVRAVLLWVANPLLIMELVIGGHLDALRRAVRDRGDRLVRRCTTVWHDVRRRAARRRRGRHQDRRRLRRARHRDPADARPRVGAAGPDRRGRRG